MTVLKLFEPFTQAVELIPKINSLIYLFWSIFFLFFSSSILVAQQLQDRSEIEAYRLSAEEEFVFDGSIEEAFWGRIEPATGFIQQEPNEGAAATERTEVRLAYEMSIFTSV